MTIRYVTDIAITHSSQITNVYGSNRNDGNDDDDDDNKLGTALPRTI